MTWPPVGTAGGTNNMGPYASQADFAAPISGTPAAPAAPNAPSGTSTTATNFTNSWNYVNGKLAVQVDLDNIMDGTQQGTPAITNVTSTTLAGYAVGACSFVQTSGSYNSVK
jgi:hypothetical protein